MRWSTWNCLNGPHKTPMRFIFHARQLNAHTHRSLHSFIIFRWFTEAINILSWFSPMTAILVLSLYTYLRSSWRVSRFFFQHCQMETFLSSKCWRYGHRWSVHWKDYDQSVEMHECNGWQRHHGRNGIAFTELETFLLKCSAFKCTVTWKIIGSQLRAEYWDWFTFF